MKFNIITLGCKVNAYESDFIKEQFIKKGYTFVSLNEEPDVVVVNTCSVTNQSDAKSRHMLRMARKQNPKAILVATGCSSQNHQEKLKELDVDILIGNKGKSQIVSLVEKYKQNKEKISDFCNMQNLEFEDMFLENETDKTRAFVKIQDGCENFCSYCIIPYMRGNIRSKDIDVAYKEIECLVKMGHKEIVLTGIHTGSYGRGTNYDLVDLIQKISKIKELLRIRISSIEITELNEKFLEELKNNKKICNHMHIPLQSGSDYILSKMNRKYDTKYYLDKIHEIRNIRPDISITTDLIVGFPYEDDKYFNETFEFLKKIKFTKIHTFPFSLRSGTKAEEMKDNFVDEKVKKERVKKVIELSNKLEHEYYSQFLGSKLDIIVENSKDDYSCGHTDNYIQVNVDTHLKSGIIKSVIIDKIENTKVYGHIE